MLVIIHRCSLFANNLPTQRTRSWLTWNDTIFKTKSQTQHKNLSNWNLYIVYMAIIDPDQAPSKFPIVSHTKSVSSLQELIAFCCSILIHKSNLTSWFCTSTSKLQSTHKLHQTDWTCLNLIARHECNLFSPVTYYCNCWPKEETRQARNILHADQNAWSTVICLCKTMWLHKNCRHWIPSDQHTRENCNFYK